VFNAKIVVGGRVTGIHWIADTRWVRVWIQTHTHERLWVRVWVEFCLTGMDSGTIYLCTTRSIAIPRYIRYGPYGPTVCPRGHTKVLLAGAPTIRVSNLIPISKFIIRVLSFGGVYGGCMIILVQA
jgi:hypothetical protein